MIITLSGDPGSGKSTIAKMIANTLGYKNYYVGGMRRELAKKRGITLADFNKLGEKESFTDTEVDEWQKKLGRTDDNFIIEGRTSHFFIPHAIKIYLQTKEKVGAKRILHDVQSGKNRKNEDTELNTLEAVIQSIQDRKKSDNKRYMKYYKKDMYNLNEFNLVLDTSHLSIDEVYKKIITFIKSRLPS